ncbi:cadherin-12-like [Arapaima gigas]
MKVPHQRKKGTLMSSKEDVRDNVIHYDDEGGGEEDTHAFDMVALCSPKVSDGDLLRESALKARSHSCPLKQDRLAVQDYIQQRLQDHTADTNCPPYDSLVTYGYEGNGSLAGSLSPIESETAGADEDLKCLRELGSPITSLIEILNKLDVQSDSTGNAGV